MPESVFSFCALRGCGALSIGCFSLGKSTDNDSPPELPSIFCMRISTRLVLLVAVAFGAIMATYAAVTISRRVALLRSALIHETEVLGATLQITARNAVRDGRLADLHRVLEEVASDPETVAALVSDERGQILAGGMADDSACLKRALSEVLPVRSGVSGWITCGGRLRWAVLPLPPPASVLVLVRQASLIEQEVTATRWRLSLLTLLLIGSATLVIHFLLRRTLSAPLAEITRGIREIRSASPREPIHVSPAAGELYHLANAFSDMAAELQDREYRLIREAEERVTLERRLHETEKFAIIGRLSGGLAHELGSPLNVIGMRAEAILNTPDALPAVHLQAEEIVGEVNRISQLVHGLLHAGGRQGIASEPLNLAEVIRSVVEHATPHIQRANAELQLQLPQAPVVISGQATLLRHALLNLVRNAVQALTEHVGQRCLRIDVTRGVNMIQIVVEDTGPGIPEEHLPHVYEPFYTTKTVGEGTGLGLSISYGIIEEHGGVLRIESLKEGGVRATVILPSADISDTSQEPTG